MEEMMLCKNRKDGERRRMRLCILVAMMGIFTFLTGCAAASGGQSGGDSLTSAEKTLNETVTPIAFPEGVHLTGFFITHQGMAVEPYYIMKETEDGVYLKIFATTPDDWTLYADSASQEGILDFVDTENAQIAKMQDAAAVQALEDAIVQSGALGWNGYDAFVPMEDALDADDTYILYLELSDDTTVTMHGHNTRPKGFAELLSQTQEIYCGIFPD